MSLFYVFFLHVGQSYLAKGSHDPPSPDPVTALLYAQLLHNLC